MKSADNTWIEPGYPAAIEFSPEALEGVRERSLAGLRGVPKVGVGGLLLGTRDGVSGEVRVGAVVDVPCTHAGGPSFSLTPEELAHAVSLVRAPRELSVVGWYLSRTQPPVAPRAADLNLYASLCPAAWQIMVMVRPGYVDETKAVVFFRDSSGEVVAGSVRDIQEQQEVGGRAASLPVSGADTQVDSGRAQRGDQAARRPVSGAAAGNTNQPEGAHGFEPVRSFGLVPDKQPGSLPAAVSGSPEPVPSAPVAAKKSVFQKNPFASSQKATASGSPAGAHRDKPPAAGAPSGAESPGSGPGSTAVGKKSVFQQNPFASSPTAAALVPPAGAEQGKPPAAGAPSGAESPGSGPGSTAVGKKSVFQQNPFASSPTVAASGSPAGAEQGKPPASGAPSGAESPGSGPGSTVVGKKSIFQQNPFASRTAAAFVPPAGAEQGKEPVSGAPAGAESPISHQNPFPVPPTPVPPTDARGGKEPASGVSAHSGASIPAPVGPSAHVSEDRVAAGFEPVPANSLPRSKAPLSRPAGDAEGAATPLDKPSPSPEPNPSLGAHGFEAFRPQQLVRGTQSAPAPETDQVVPEPRPAARVMASRTPAEATVPPVPRRKWLLIGSVAAAVLSVVAWATTSIWLGAPLRLELSEAGGHITAIWNTDGVSRGVAGTLVVTDSGKTVTIALSPEKVITGVAGFNPKTGNISAILKIGSLEAKAQWRAPDNWAPPEAVESKPASDGGPTGDPKTKP